jgi:hypothetical protein
MVSCVIRNIDHDFGADPILSILTKRLDRRPSDIPHDHARVNPKRQLIGAFLVRFDRPLDCPLRDGGNVDQAPALRPQGP